MKNPTYILAEMLNESLQAAKSLYGERWEEVRKQARENRLIPHHKAHKTKSLLASAVDLLTEEEDARLQLVLIAAALED